jgi:hypothetical protein
MKNTQPIDDNALAARIAILESQLGLSAAAQAAAAIAELEAEIQERQLQAQELYAETRRQGANVESHRLAILEAEKAHRLAARDASNAENRWRLHVDETRRLQAELDAMKAQQAGRIEAQRAPVVRSLPHAPRPN